MILREATLHDLPDLLDVQEAGAVLALGHLFPQDCYPFPRATIRARWETEIADPDTSAYVAIGEPGDLVGFAATRDDQLLHFGTAVETWGSGLAQAAHDTVLQRLAAAGHERVRLRVFEDNRRARRFYERLGWHETGERSCTPFPPHPVLLNYTKSLRAT